MTSGLRRTTYSGLSSGNGPRSALDDVPRTYSSQKLADEGGGSGGIGRTIHLEVHRRRRAAPLRHRALADLTHGVFNRFVEHRGALRTFPGSRR